MSEPKEAQKDTSTEIEPKEKLEVVELDDAHLTGVVGGASESPDVTINGNCNCSQN